MSKLMFLRKSLLSFWCACGVLIINLAMVHAQISAGGTPPSFQQAISSSAESRTMPLVNVETLLAEDEAEQANADPLSPIPPRFAYRHEVNLNLNNSGSWSTLPNGDRVWRLRVESPGARAIHFVYSAWRISKGSQLFIYNDDRSEVIGAFTSDNNWHTGRNITGLVHGDAVTLEYVVPLWQEDDGELAIEGVCHSYRGFFDSNNPLANFGQSAACNVNVNCSPHGDNWQDEKRGVALMTTAGGFRFCSGSLIRSACNDYDPLFYTAYHCLPAGDPSTYLFIFNYEGAGCANPGSEPSTAQSIANADHLADWRGADAGWFGNDFAIMRLSSTPPASYNAYMNGWNRVAVNPTNVTGIHHPQGDIKKISIDDDFVPAYSYPGDTAATHWLTTWDVGTIEGGSSGSPLFNSSGQIIGAAHGSGGVLCPPNTYSAYGMFHLSWEGNGAPDSRVKDHIDPCNTNATSLNGFNLGPPENDLCPGLNVGTGLAALPYTNASNTVQSTNDYTATCANNTPGKDNVYQWTSQEAATITVGLCDSGYDTGLYVRQGSCDGPQVGCDDDACTTPNTLGSIVTFTACAHTTYYIFVDGYHANAGGSYTLTMEGSPAPLPGDLCSNPIEIATLPYSHDNDNSCYERNENGHCSNSFHGRDVIYRWTSPACPQTVSANTCNSSFDTGLYVREGTCNGPGVACDDDACVSPNGAGSMLSFTSAPNTVYYFIVDGYLAESKGTYTLEISSTPATIAGDLCDGAIAVNTLPYTTSGTTACATDQDYGSCQNGPAPDMVFRLNLSPEELGPCSIVRASLCGSNFDTRLGVKTGGACPGTTDLGCNDDSYCSGVFGLLSNVTFAATPNTDYYVTVFGHNGNAGDYTLTLTNVCAPESLVIHSSGNDIVLNWRTGESEVSSEYNVYRSETLPVDPIGANFLGTTLATSYTDVNAANNPASLYYYVVTASHALLMTEQPEVPVAATGRQIGECVTEK